MYYTNVLKVVKCIDSYQRVRFACLQQQVNPVSKPQERDERRKIIIKREGLEITSPDMKRACHVLGEKLRVFDPQTSQAGATGTKTEPRLINIMNIIPAHVSLPFLNGQPFTKVPWLFIIKLNIKHRNM